MLGILRTRQSAGLYQTQAILSKWALDVIPLPKQKTRKAISQAGF
jgi:hypothetical protein